MRCSSLPFVLKRRPPSAWRCISSGAEILSIKGAISPPLEATTVTTSLLHHLAAFVSRLSLNPDHSLPRYTIADSSGISR